MEDGKGGHRQKKFNLLFSKMLPMATKQLLSFVCNIVRSKYPNELAVRSRDRNGSLEQFDNGHRIATAIVESTKDQCFYISVAAGWFKDNICEHLGIVVDCYIGKGYRNGDPFILFDNESNVVEQNGSTDSEIEPIDVSRRPRRVTFNDGGEETQTNRGTSASV